jgi:signal transduction histidine kinase
MLRDVVQELVDIGRSLDLDTTLQAIVEGGRRLTGARYGALGVLGPDRRIARFVTSGMDDEQVARIGHYPTGRGILGVLIDEARPLRLAEIAADPRSSGFPPDHPPMRSFLGVPVQAKGAIYGNLYLTESPNGEFSDEDEQLVTLLAAQAGAAIENARLYAEARHRTEEARRAADDRARLAVAAANVLREPDLSTAMTGLAHESRTLVRARLMLVGIPDEFAGVVRFPVAVGSDADAFRGTELPLDGSLPGSVLQAGVPMQVDGRDRATLTRFAPADGYAGRVLLAVPVLLGEESVAILAAIDPVGRELFSDDDRALLEAFASLAAVSFQTTQALRRERTRSEALARLRQVEAEAEGRQETLARVVEAQERERRRLAQDLHDRTAGSLAALLMGLRRLERDVDEGPTRERLAGLRLDVAASIEDLRDLIADLRPKVLDDFGLGAALERLAEATRRRTGLPVTVTLDPGLDTLPEEHATAAYRIAQEAVTNVVRHARASAARISAATDGRVLTLAVEDDGVGLSGEVGAGGGYGVDGMRERARLVNGTLGLAGREGGGTRVWFEARL